MVKEITAYEEYDYQLPLKKMKSDILVKRYDLLKPTRSLIEENQRYLKIQNENHQFVCSLLYDRFDCGELDFPSTELFYFQQQQFISDRHKYECGDCPQ